MLFPNALVGQASESFFYAPGLELSLPREKWERKRQTYDEAMWNPGRHHLRNEADDISIYLECDLTVNLETHPDSMDALVEQRLDYIGTTYRKEMINGFTLYLITPWEGGPDDFQYSAQAKHPWGHFASLSLSIPATKQKDADEKARNILKQINMRTPAEVDKAQGLPFPASTDLDSLFKARVEEIRKTAKGKYPEDYLEAELSKLKREDLVWDAMDGYCWEKRYRIRSQIERGGFSLDDALNHHFLGIDAPDIAFFQREFKMDGGGLSTGINKVVQRNGLSAIDTLRFDYFFREETKFYNHAKTYYWALSAAEDSMGCLLLCYWRESGKWMMHHQEIAYPWKAAADQIMDYLPEYDRDPHDYTGEPSFPKQHKLNTVRIFDTDAGPSQVQEWAFNAFVPQSNTVALPAYVICDSGFDVAYLISDIHAVNGRADMYQPPAPPNVRDSTDFLTLFAPSFEKQFTVASIQADTALRRQLCEDERLCAYLNGEENIDDFYGYANRPGYWEKTAIHNSCVLHSASLPPAKRLYIAAPQFGDLDGNGKEELLQFKVSNGKLIDYFVVEADAQGVQRLPPSKAWEDRISKTEYFQALVRMSLQKENLLARWGE